MTKNTFRFAVIVILLLMQIQLWLIFWNIVL